MPEVCFLASATRSPESARLSQTKTLDAGHGFDTEALVVGGAEAEAEALLVGRPQADRVDGLVVDDAEEGIAVTAEGVLFAGDDKAAACGFVLDGIDQDGVGDGLVVTSEADGRGQGGQLGVGHELGLEAWVVGDEGAAHGR